MSSLDLWLALRLPRERPVLRRLVARWGGFFWLPCPCCGRCFAGFEIGQRHVDHERDPGGCLVSRGCCRWCDACAGAEREQADLAARLGLEDVEFVAAGGTVRLLTEGPTPDEWRCGP